MSRRVDEDWFGVRVSGAELRDRTILGIASMTVARFATQTINFASILVLARMLLPRDFGLVAIASVVIGLAGVLTDLGLSAATVRYGTLTAPQASNLFWANLAGAILAAVLIVIVSPFVDRQLADGVGAITAALSFGLVLSALGTQHRALLRRAVRFDLTMRIGILSTLVASVLSVLCALGGFGYWSLIAGSLAGIVLSTAMAWRYCTWRPGPPRRGVGTRPLLMFGLRMFVFGALAFVSNNLHTLLIGRLSGATAAGLYTRGFSILRFFRDWIVTAPRQVLPTAMARVADDADALASYYYRGCTFVVVMVVAVAFVGVALPHELVYLVFGPRWDASAEVVRALSIGVVPQVICGTSGWIYMSVGSADRMMRWGFVSWGAMIGGALIGSLFIKTHGIQALAWASSISIIAITWPCMSAAFHGTALTWRGLAGHLRGPLAAGLVAGLVAWTALGLIETAPAVVRLFTGCSLFAGLDLMLLATVAGERRLLADAWTTLRRMVSAKLPSP